MIVSLDITNKEVQEVTPQIMKKPLTKVLEGK